jgi:16S rRNA (cytosine967-C5)-methyltransferase
LLYVVCSIFPEEGVRQVERFGARWPGARAVPLPGGLGTSVQLLPSAMKARHPFRGPGLPTVHDGFFFALFEKT